MTNSLFQISIGDVLISVNGKDIRNVPYDDVIRSLSGPSGSKVSLGLVRGERHQQQHLHMHVRELMFHHRVVEITTLTRQPKRQSVLPARSAPPSDACTGRAQWSPPAPAAAAAPSGSTSSTLGLDAGEGAACCNQPRQPRHAAPPRAAPPDTCGSPPHPGAGAARASYPLSPGDLRPPHGVSASVGEVAVGGHFEPLLVT
jgi:hypothetical protein